jgi:hypothetical protein
MPPRASNLQIHRDKTHNQLLNKKTMKKLILSLAVSAFALAAVQADNNAKAPSEKNATCCEANKTSCCSKSACTKGMPTKTVLMSPKAAAAAGKS